MCTIVIINVQIEKLHLVNKYFGGIIANTIKIHKEYVTVENRLKNITDVDEKRVY